MVLSAAEIVIFPPRVTWALERSRPVPANVPCRVMAPVPGENVPLLTMVAPARSSSPELPVNVPEALIVTLPLQSRVEVVRVTVPLMVRSPATCMMLVASIPESVSIFPVATLKLLVTVKVWETATSIFAALVRERVVIVEPAFTSILPVVRSAPVTDTELMVLEAPETSRILAELFNIRGLVLLMAPTSERVSVKAPMLTNAPE